MTLKLKTPTRKDNDDGTVTIVLAYPFKYGDEEYTEITLRRPKGKALRMIDATKGSVTVQGMKFIEALSGVPAKAVEEMDTVDIEACSLAIPDLMGKSLGTGEPS